MTNGLPVTLLPVVAVALTDTRGRVLVQRRALGKQHAGLWEFPGGKIEPGETPEAALAREIAEELDIVIDPAALAPITFVSTPHGERQLLLLLYRCHSWRGDPRALDADALAWRLPRDLGDLPMPPADGALVEWLIQAG